MPENKEKSLGIEKQLVIFKLGKEEFGVDINQVREIIKMEAITKIPNTEEYIQGVINLRGKIIVIVELSKKLNMISGEKNKDTRIIVTEIGDSTIGMIVDNCNEVLRLSSSQIEAAPEIITKKINSEYIVGVGVIKERLIILLNLGKVLGDSDMQKLEALKETV
ncbi:MAG: chemotaxis protein CheW [archaeon]